jgi:hypothetical protein
MQGKKGRGWVAGALLSFLAHAALAAGVVALGHGGLVSGHDPDNVPVAMTEPVVVELREAAVQASAVGIQASAVGKHVSAVRRTWHARRAAPKIAARTPSAADDQAGPPIAETMLAAVATVAPAPRALPAVAELSSRQGSYLRISDSFPENGLGRHFTVVMRVCVAATGAVDSVTVQESGGPDADRMLARDLRSWRYRPLMMEGIPTPFCHCIRMDY